MVVTAGSNSPRLGRILAVTAQSVHSTSDSWPFYFMLAMHLIQDDSITYQM